LQLVAGAAFIRRQVAHRERAGLPSAAASSRDRLYAGGSADLTVRLMGQWPSEKLGQSFVIEYRLGSGTNVATESVLRAISDGYTLLLVAPANDINARDGADARRPFALCCRCIRHSRSSRSE
jgi:hypothetical protein